MARRGCFASAGSRGLRHEEALVGYRLRSGQPVVHEVLRIANRQLELAIAGLNTADDAESRGVHATRRHVKKVRALIRLVRPALGRVRYRSVNRRLRVVNRRLAPVADGQAVLGTLARVAERYRDELPRDVSATIHKELVRRAAIAYEEAAVNNVREAAAAMLRRERDGVSDWQLGTTGFRAIAGGLERTVRDGRRAMAKAVTSARSEDYHTWRQRVKDLWLQTRLLQARCGNRLAAHERRLEELDGFLGECHNCAILCAAVRSESTLTRTDAARCLRLVRRYERSLRRAARELGATVYRDTPAQYVTRVERHWRSARQRRRRDRRGTSWRTAA
jgi:hypothetical protein